MSDYLNGPLYRALSKLYGEVRVRDKGVTGDYRREVKVVQREGSTRTYVNYRSPTSQYGEQYQFDCPFCGDTRKRMYVGYLFGTRDRETEQLYLGGVHCFNADCHEEYSFKRQLYDDVELAGFGDYAMVDHATRMTDADESAPQLTERGLTTPPGECVLLSQIPESSPEYEAVRYLRDERGFDVDYLERFYGVEYLRRGYQYRFLAGRIYTPFFRDGMLIAWTARVVPKLSDSDIRHSHCPGGLGGLLYGLGGALRLPVLTIVEGPADRWAVGNSGVALLSKKLGAQKQLRLFRGLVGSAVEAIVVLLDPEQPEVEKQRGKPHQILETTEIIRRNWGKPVIPVFLPGTVDPAECAGDYLASYLYAAMRAHGYQQLGEILARDVLSSTASRAGYRGVSNQLPAVL